MATTLLSIVPTIGTKGVWTAKPPFSSKILTKVIYECVALRSLADIVAEGQDPLSTYYTPNGLTSTDYQADVKAGAIILTLMAEDNSMVYIPSTWLKSYPDGNGVGYRVKGILVKLTAIPDSLSLDGLVAKIQSDCLNMIGVDAQAAVVAISNMELVNATDNANYEQQRKNNITNNTTDFAELQAAIIERDEYMQRCTLLEEMLAEQLGLESTNFEST